MKRGLWYVCFFVGVIGLFSCQKESEKMELPSTNNELGSAKMVVEGIELDNVVNSSSLILNRLSVTYINHGHIGNNISSADIILKSEFPVTSNVQAVVVMDVNIGEEGNILEEFVLQIPVGRTQGSYNYRRYGDLIETTVDHFKSVSPQSDANYRYSD